jgi:ATP-dependent Clp protease ATP-binding subunit ClpA
LEPTIAESIQILNGLASRYAVFHNVIYSKEAIKAAVNLSAVHIHDRQLPDKAIDVLDESGAKANILNKDGDKTPKVRVADIESIVAGMAKIPPKSVSQYDRAKLENLEAALNQNIFGQEAAISQCCESIILARSPLGDKARPIGSFLFCGSTGVGKTELAKQLAELMGIALIRFDMSEYMEKHTVSRLIGAPPGYIGFDQGGLLTDAIHKTPHAVLLLDEIEKAHEDITNILLQVMDYGALTDANGRKTDFNNAIIILTTNAGSREMNTATIGYRGDDQVKQLSTKVVEKIFNPEFRNRLSAIVLFNPITQPIVEKIVKKEIKVLEKRLAENQLSIQLEDDAIKYLCDKGFDSANGARMIKQIIESEISRPLAKKILFKKPPRGSKILINCKDGRLNHIVIDHIEFPLGDKSKGEAKEELDEANTQNV